MAKKLPVLAILTITLLLFSQVIQAQPDECTSAFGVTVGTTCNFQVGTTSGYTDSSFDSSCGGNEDEDAWLVFTATSDITSVIIQSNSGDDMVLTIVSECDDEIACVNDTGAGGTETISFASCIGDTYYVHLYDFGIGGGNFQFCVVEGNISMPAFDTYDCFGAEVVCADGTYSNIGGIGNDDFANPNNQQGCISSGEDDVFWMYIEFDASTAVNDTLEFEISTPGLDYDFAVFGPNVPCDNLGAPVRCEWVSTAGLTGLAPGPPLGYDLPLIVNPNEYYFVMVNSWPQGTNPGSSFDIDFTGPAADNMVCGTPPPAPTFCDVLVSIDADTTVCEGASFTLEPCVGGATGSTTFEWTATGIGTTYLSSTTTQSPVLTLPPGVTGIIEFEIEVTDGTCVSQAEIEIDITPLPTATSTTLEACDEGGGSATFNLLSLDATVGGGLPNVTYYSDPAGTMVISPPGTYVSASTTIYAGVDDGTCFSSIVPITLTVNTPNCDDGCPLTVDSFDATCNCINTPPACDDGCPLTVDSFDSINCQCDNVPPNCDDACPLTTDSWDQANCQCVNAEPTCDDGCPLTLDTYDAVNCQCNNSTPNCDDSCALTTDTWNQALCQCENTPPNCDDGCPLTTDIWDAASCFCINSPPNCDDGCPLTTDSYDSVNCQCVNAEPTCDDGCPLTVDSYDTVNCQCVNTEPTCDDACPLTTDSYDAVNCQCINTEPTCDDACPLTVDSYDAVNCQCVNTPPTCDDGCPLTVDSYDNVNCQCINTPPTCDDGCPLTTDSYDSVNCLCVNTEPTCDDGCPFTVDSYDAVNCQCVNTPPACDDGCPLTVDSYDNVNCQCVNTPPTCDDACPLTTDSYDSVNCLCVNTEPTCDDGCPFTVDSYDAVNCQCVNTPPACDDGCPLTVDSYDNVNCQCVNTPPTCDDGCPLTTDSYDSVNCLCVNTEPTCDDGCPLTADSYDAVNCQCVNTPPACDDGCPLTVDSYDSVNCQCVNTPPTCDDACPLTTDSYDSVNCQCINAEPTCDDGCPLTTDSYDSANCQCVNTPPACDDGCPLTVDSYDAANCQCVNAEPTCDDGCPLTTDSYDSANCNCVNTEPACDDGCPLTVDSYDAVNCQCVNTPPACDDGCPLTVDSYDSVNCQCVNTEPACDDGCPLTTDSYDAANCQCVNVEPTCDDGCPLTTDSYDAANCNCVNTEPACDDGCPLTTDSYDAANCQCVNAEPTCDDGCPLTTDSYDSANCQCVNVEPTCDDGCPLTTDSYDAANCNCVNTEPACDDGCPLTTDSYDAANCQCVNAEPTCDDGCPLTTDSYDAANCQCVNTEPACDDGCPLTTDSYDSANCLCVNTPPNCDDACPLTVDSWDNANCQCVNTPPNCDDGCPLTADTWNQTNCQCDNTPPNCDDGCPLTADTWDQTNCQCDNTPPNCDDACPLTTDSWDNANCQCINTEPTCDDGCPLTTDSYDAVNCQCDNTEPSCDDGCPLTTDSYDSANCQCVNTEPTCDDGCPLTTDTYDAVNCQCNNTPPNCDDGCQYTTDSFNFGTCQCDNILTTPSCDDNNCATTDSYDAVNCLCINTPIPPPLANPVGNTICEDVIGSGTAIFDLTLFTSAINVGTTNPVSFEDAAGVPILNPSNYTSGNAIITAIVGDGNNPPCQTSTTTVTLGVQPNISAGTAVPQITECNSNNNTIVLSDLLTGEDPGGSWTETSAIPSSGGAFNAAAGTFTPNGQAGNVYTFEYSTPVIAPCLGDSETVSILLEEEPFAILSTTNLTTCNSSSFGSILDFVALITGGDTNGNWADINGAGVNLGNPSNVDFNGVSPGSYDFTYTTNSATAPCVEQIYTISVLVQDCGCPSVATIPPDTDLCTDNDVLDVNNLLITAEAGTWSVTSTPPGGSPTVLSGSIFNATGAVPGTYEVTFTLTTPPPANCPNSSSENIEVNAIPTINNPGNQSACDSYTLPTITGSNLSGNEAFFTGPNGTGAQYVTGSIINFSTPLFIYDANGSCAAEESFIVTIQPTPTIINPGNQAECDAYTLPTINGVNLSGSAAYFTGPNGTGTQYAAGQMINASTTLFIYDANGTCTDEESFNINITTAPSFINPGSPSVCGDYELPAIMGLNLTGNEAYYLGPNGSSTQLFAGDLITGTTAVWIYDIVGSCVSEEIFVVTISPEPNAGSAIIDLEICNSDPGATSLNGLLAGADPGGSWSETSAVPSTGNAFNPFAGTFIANGQAAGTYTFEYLVTGNPPCVDDTETVTIIIEEEPFAVLNPNNVTICNVSAQGSIVDLEGLIVDGDLGGDWTDTNGSGVNLSDPSNVDFDGIAASIYVFTYTTNSAGNICQEQSYIATVLVENCACPSVATSAPPNNICNDDDFIDLTSMQITGEAGTWSITMMPAGVSPAFIIGNFFNATNADPGDYEVTFTLDNAPPVGCPSESTQIIQVDAIPDLTDPGDILSCGDYTLPAIIGTNLSGNEAYYTMPNAGGLLYNIGDVISTSQTLYIYDNNNGCFSELSFELTVSNDVTNNLTESICTGEVYTINDVDYEMTGLWTETIIGGAFNGCDSIINLDLTVNDAVTENIVAQICTGDVYTINGVDYDMTGMWSETIMNGALNGCDSIINLDLTVNDAVTENIVAQICTGEVYTINGVDYDMTGMWSETIMNGSLAGCDSIINLDLTVNDAITENIVAEICTGEVYTINGVDYDMTGMWSETIMNGSLAGCDSIINLDLTVNDAVTENIVAQICTGDVYTINGVDYDMTGMWSETIMNGSIGGCDSIINLDLTVNDAITENIVAEICTGEVYEINGVDYDMTGMWQETIMNGSLAGCDSIINLDLTVNDAVTENIVAQICTGEVYEINGVDYDMTGMWSETIMNGALNGCDSIINLDLTVNDAVTENIVAQICTGDVYTINGVDYDMTGMWSETIMNGALNGCDSIINLDLTVNDAVTENIVAQICTGQVYTINGVDYDMTGMWSETIMNGAFNGCDSIINLDLTVNDAVTENIVAQICTGQVYEINGVDYDMTGIWTETIMNGSVGGCDSIINLDLTVNDAITEDIVAEICNGQVYEINGVDYSTTGMWQEIIMDGSVAGCDSIINLDLTVNDAITEDIVAEICDGQVYTINGVDYGTEGIWTETIMNGALNGCDSIINLDLTVNDAVTNQLTEAICEGEVYTINGVDYNMTGIWTETIMNGATNGCDSIIELDLTVNIAQVNDIVAEICTGQVYTINEVDYNTTGMFTETIMGGAANGCDSIINLDLTVNNAVTNNLVETICEGEVYTINEVDYNTTGIWTETIIGGAFGGCDSIINLDLTVNLPIENNLTETICEDEVYTINGVDYNTTGIWTETIMNGAANGCDSVINLDLTVNLHVVNDMVETICDGAIITINGVDYGTEGMFTETIIDGAANGCDSIINLDLTVNDAVTNDLVEAICDGQVYTINGVDYDMTGLWSETVIAGAANGCDSIITLDLTVNTEVTNNIDSTICEGEVVEINGVPYSAAGVHDETIPNGSFEGCDSTIVLTLAVNNDVMEPLDESICDGDIIIVNGMPFSTEGVFNIPITNGAANGCDSIVVLTLSLLDCEIEVFITSEPIDCNGDMDGIIDILITSGLAPYTYSWENTTTSDMGNGNIDVNNNNEQLTGLNGGNYSISITDSDGGITVYNVLVEEPPLLTSIIQVTNNLDCDGNDIGALSVVPQGGTPNYSYLWSNNEVTQNINGLGEGEYFVTITDQNGCTTISSMMLTSPDGLEVFVSSTAPNCFGESNGSIVVDSVSGGVSPYLYSLNGEVPSQANSFTNLEGGFYQLSVSDIEGCTWTEDIPLNPPVELSLELGDEIDLILGDSSELIAQINIQPSEIASIVWVPEGIFSFKGDSLRPYARPFESTMVTVVITNVNGCVISDNVLISVDETPPVYVPNAFSPNGDGINDIFIPYGGPGVGRIRSFLVFDRWGETVHQFYNFPPNDENFGWNGKFHGKALNSAVFVYFVEAEMVDGRVIIFEGEVVLQGTR